MSDFDSQDVHLPTQAIWDLVLITAELGQGEVPIAEIGVVRAPHLGCVVVWAQALLLSITHLDVPEGTTETDAMWTTQ